MINAQEALSQAGFRITPGRIKVFGVLRKGKPVTMADVSSELKNSIDGATVYRTLESFVEKGIANHVHFKDRSVRYELADLPHHHHVVCEDCGAIEDVDVCADDLGKEALKSSHKFSTITQHSVEFFGICNDCSSVKNLQKSQAKTSHKAQHSHRHTHHTH